VVQPRVATGADEPDANLVSHDFSL
jgi:hypothetical protein